MTPLPPNMKKLLLVTMFVIAAAAMSSSGDGAETRIQLIHRDSPSSPFYNSTKTDSELWIAVDRRSRARLQMFSARRSHRLDSSSKLFQVPLTFEGDYLMKVYLGSPLKEIILIADTGSSLTWLQCTPCIPCFQQRAPIYDPSLSSTYSAQGCYSSTCYSVPADTYCGKPGDYCRYEIVYQDESRSVGQIATEYLSFSSDGARGKNITMGCGMENKGEFSNSAGIAGLGNSKGASLVYQFGDVNGLVFSHCLSPSFTSGILRFMPNSTIARGADFVTTPLIEDTEDYIIRLEYVSINNDTDEQYRVIPSKPENHQLILDLGTTFTYLESGFYNDVEQMLKNFMKQLNMPSPPKPFKLCYDGLELYDVPPITLHLGAGTSILFPPQNFYVPIRNGICLAILPHKDNSVFSLLGNIAMKNYEVEFDILQGNVTFTPKTSCT